MWVAFGSGFSHSHLPDLLAAAGTFGHPWVNALQQVLGKETPVSTLATVIYFELHEGEKKVVETTRTRYDKMERSSYVQ